MHWHLNEIVKYRTVKSLKVCRLLLVFLQETSGFIQDAAILWDEEVSVAFVNLKLLPNKLERAIRDEHKHLSQKTTTKN